MLRTVPLSKPCGFVTLIVHDPVTLTTIHKGNCNMLLRESIPRQVGKKSGAPEEEKGIWGSQGGDRCLEFSRRKKRQMFFSTFLSKDYITIMYPA